MYTLVCMHTQYKFSDTVPEARDASVNNMNTLPSDLIFI